MSGRDWWGVGSGKDTENKDLCMGALLAVNCQCGGLDGRARALAIVGRTFPLKGHELAGLHSETSISIQTFGRNVSFCW